MEIRIKGLTRSYFSEGRQIRALDGVDVTIPANQIFTLLGPSGCGKTTLLRCIVGLEVPDDGEIIIGEQTVWSREKNIFVPPERRGLGMVFQTYAIWPHMNVFENVAYPLTSRKMAKDEVRARVARALQFVQLAGLEHRPATKLSGGQQQRVALARALVAEPKVILFDEPLSNLDAKLREETRKELRHFLTELQITAVYVTHDRIEALALSDQVAIMRAGKIVEIGDPKQVYFNSGTQFVADFIGRANLIKGAVVALDGEHAVLDTDIGPVRGLNSHGLALQAPAELCVRPEFIRIAEQPVATGDNLFCGTMETLVFIGEAYEGDIRVGEQLFTTTIPPNLQISEGDEVPISFSPDHCFLLPAQEEP